MYSKDMATKVFQGKIFSVWQWEQKLFDGSMATFERITRPDTVYMLPILANQQIVLIRDQQPQRDEIITIPRGRVEEGEQAEAAASRECLEETGYVSQDIQFWHAYQPAGKISWTISFFIGRNAEKKSVPASDPGERMTLLPVSFDDFITMAAEGQLQDPMIQILILQAKLDPQKMTALKTLLYGNK